jgi:hypothetical protein
MAEPKASRIVQPLGKAPSRKLAEKRARREARAARKKRGRDWTRLVYLSLIPAIALGALVFVAYIGTHQEKAIQPAVGAKQLVGDKVPLESASHIASGQATYLTDPPTSGPHYNQRGQAPLPWGYYDQAYPPEDWLHNLEHGGVVILYQCDQPETKVGGAKLINTPLFCPDSQTPVQDFISSAPKDAIFSEVKIVATPYAVPGHRFALVAWGWRLFMDSWDSRLAEKFYEAHVDNGPERIP